MAKRSAKPGNPMRWGKPGHHSGSWLGSHSARIVALEKQSIHENRVTAKSDRHSPQSGFSILKAVSSFCPGIGFSSARRRHNLAPIQHHPPFCQATANLDLSIPLVSFVCSCIDCRTSRSFKTSQCWPIEHISEPRHGNSSTAQLLSR